MTTLRSALNALVLAMAGVLMGVQAAEATVDRLRVTELHYHPANPVPAEAALGGHATDDTRYEFIELTNIGAEPLDASGVAFTEGVTYVFPPGTTIPSGGKVLLVKDLPSFRARYGHEIPVLGEYSGSLGNSSEALTLASALGTTVQTFTYLDTWYPSTDGPGYSLKVVDANQALTAWDTAAGWAPSGSVHGSPGYPDAAVSGLPHFSRASGTFIETFSLVITADDPASAIHVTTDGTLPTTASPVYSGPIAIAATTRVRAVVKGAGLPSGPVMSATYVQLDPAAAGFATHLPVVVVETFGAGVPSSSSVNRATGAFTVLPAPGEGADTLGERTAAIVQRVGVREHGSSSAGFPKQSLSIESWDEADEDSDMAPLGMPKGEDWVLIGPYNYDSALIRNAAAYELSNRIGRWAPRIRFCEVFTNHNGGGIVAADYQGVFILAEKIKRGSNRLDIEKLSPTDTLPPAVQGGYILKIDRADPDDTGLVIATGTPERQVVQMVYPDLDVLAPEQRAWITGHLEEFVAAIQAADFRNPITGLHYSDYIDVDSWIDHHILNVVFQNVDGLRLSAYLSKARDGKLVAGPAWDFDRSADSKDSRDNNPFAMKGTNDSTDYFGYIWWNRLFADPDFSQRYADRMKELLATRLTVTELHGIVDQFALPLNAVILPETSSPAARDAAKWSANAPRSFTQGDVTVTGYLAEAIRLKAWLADRLEFLAGNWLDAPVFSRQGGTVEAGYPLILSAPLGTIHYTVDGTDPRAAGGAPAPGAVAYTGPIPISGPMTVSARVHDGTRWSALSRGSFVIASETPLRITELMYNPAPDADPATEDQLYEFVELKNISGTETLDLTGLRLTGGIDFTFAGGTLAPKALVVVVADQAAFEARYGAGKPVAGVYTGRLSNGGEPIRLLAAGDTEILAFTYSSAWHASTDGQGPSLVINDPFGPKPDWNVGTGWRPSYDLVDGTPGEDENSTPLATGETYAIGLNEVLPLPVAALTANDSDADIFDELSVRRVANPSSLGSAFAATKGTVSLAIDATAGPGATITYTPPANFYGTDYLSYRVVDLFNAESAVVSVRITIATPLVRINEFWTHTDSPNADGVEVHNPTAHPIGIGGWRIAKTPSGAGKKYDFPSDTVIQPGAFLVIDCDATNGDGGVVVPGEWGTTLSPKSGAVYLLPRVDGALQPPISGSTFPVSLDGQSFGYWKTSDGRVVYPIQRSKTINRANTGPKVGPVLITEIMSAPEPGEHQFIELQNTGGGPVRLDKSFNVLGETKTFGWRIDGVSFSFPPNFSLAAGQICVVVDGGISTDDFRAQHNIPPSVPVFNFSGSLELAGSRLALQQAENFDGEPTLYWLTNDLVDVGNGGLWPTVTAGSGRSITRKSKTAYGDDPANWTLSQDVGGSPGTADGASPPNAADDSYALNPGAALIVKAPGVLANDSDANRDAMSAVLKTGPANGVLTLNGNGSFAYTPNAGFNGIDTCTYQAKDSTGLLSGTVTIFFNVGRSQLDARVVNATDDAEEHEDGILDLSSTDLELTLDAKIDGTQPRGHQWIGIRFEKLAIPAGARITNAYLQFSATDEVPETDPCTLVIRADDSDDAVTFHDDIPSEISSRPRTSAAATWSPEAWTVENETSLKQRTPDLSAVVQQVVDRAGWAPGNAIAFLIDGTGKRVAEALDGARPEACAKLHVEWTLGAPYGNPESYTVTQGQTLTVPAAGGVLANDGTLGAATVLTAVLDQGTVNGALTLGADGSFSYTPLPDLAGPDQFTYRVSDGSRSSPPVTVRISVLAPTIAHAPGLDYEFWWCRLTDLAGFAELGAPIRTGTVATFDLSPRDQNDSFAFRYRGFIDLPTAGAYTFFLKSDEGSALWLDGELVVNHDGIHSNSGEKSGTVTVTATGRHAIEVRYFERDGSQSLDVRYAGPGIAKQVIPAAVLSRGTQERLLAVADAYRVARNGTLTVGTGNGVLKNDVSVLGLPLTATVVSGPSLGAFTTALTPDGTFTYRPTTDVEGYDTFTYRCTDGTTVSNLVTVTITVGTPDAAQPTANADSYTTNAGKPLVVGIAEGLLKNDIDPNGDSLRSILVSPPAAAQGTLAGNKVELDGRFTFTPAPGFIGTATFVYACNDGTFDSDPRTVTIEVLPASPLDEYEVARTAGFTQIAKDLSGIAWNPDTGTYFVIANDTTTIDGRKVQIFEYLADLTTLVRGIKITHADASSPFEDKDAYDAEDIAYLGNGDFAIAFEGHRSDDQYIPNRICIVHIDAATASVNANPGQCIRIILPNPTFDNNGIEGLTYDRAGNGGLGVFYATQEKNPITVWRFNRPADRTTIRDHDAASECALGVPFDAVALLESRFIISDLSGVMFDDRTGRLLLVSDEGQALVDVDLSGRVIGQFALPSSLEGGADQYEGITLGKDYSLVVESEPNVFTELINVTLPVAEQDTYSMPSGSSLTVAAGSGVLANDSDGNGDPLTAELITAPAVGSLTLAINGGFTYVPPSGFLGSTSFTYRAFDGAYLSQPATVLLNVSGLDHPPVANPDAYTLAEDSVYTATTSVLANDTDVDGDPKFAVIAVRPLHGLLSLRSDGRFTYTPIADHHGVDSFTYRCRAGSAESAPITVQLTITPVNDAPVAVPDGLQTTPEDTDLVLNTPGILANDHDIDGDGLTAEVTVQPEHGTLTLTSDGALVYRPVADYHGPDSFRYRARDAALPSLDVLVPITVLPANDAPVAAADAVAVDEDQTLTLPAPGVLANDHDVDGDAVIVGEVTVLPEHGTVTVAADGSLGYVPHADWYGTDTFAYTAFDSELPSAPATVTVTVNPVDDGPRPAGDSYWTRIDRPLTVAGAAGVLANDLEVDGEALVATLVTPPAHGSVALAADGSFTYTPAVGYIGADQFVYRAADSGPGAEATVDLLVKPLDLAPVIDVGIAAVAGPTSPIPAADITLRVVAHDPDLDPLPLTFAWSATGPGTVAFTPVDPAGHTVTAAFTTSGPHTITVEVSDGELSAIDTAEVVVVPAPATLAVTPDTVAVGQGAIRRFTANGTDQFGLPLAPMPTVTWSLDAGSVGTIDALGDFAAPATGTGSATVRATLGALSATATATVVAPGRVSIARVDGTAAEGTADTARFRISRAANAATPLPVLIAWSGTATAGADHADLPSLVTIPADSTSVLLTVTALDDSLNEGSESLIGTIQPDTSYTIGKAEDSIEILDDERPRLQIQANDGAGNENGTDGVAFRLVRYPVNPAVTVPVQVTLGGTATSGSDFTIATTAFAFSGSASTIAIAVTRIDDEEIEGTETIVIGLPPSDLYEVGTVSATATLHDDERPLVTLTVNDGIAGEPGTDTARVTITRRPTGATALTVAYALTGSGVGDIVPMPGTLEIPAGTASAVLTITAIDDPTMEVNETLVTTLVEDPGYLLGTASGTVTILDDDLRPADPIAGTRPGLDYAHHHGTWSTLPDFATLVPVSTGAVAAVTLEPRTRNDAFGFRFAGYLDVPTDGAYVLSTTSDDGSRLWIGDLLVVDNDGLHAMQERSGTVRLRAGKHRLLIDHFENGGGEHLAVAWQGPGFAKQALPAASLFRANAAPAAAADAYTAPNRSTITIPAATGLLANDGDADGHALTAHLVTGPGLGSVTLQPDGGFTLVTPDLPGTVTFTYLASDGDRQSEPTTVTIVITTDDQPAVAVDDAYSVDEDQVLTALVGVLANDTDPDGDALTVAQLVQPPQHGTVALAADGTFVYTPAADHSGSDSFAYTVFDGTLVSGPATVAITILPIADAPRAVADAYDVGADRTFTALPIRGVLANDTDVDGLGLAASLLTGPAHGSLDLAADGSFSYTPAAGHVGEDQFVYAATAGGVTASATVTLHVAPIALPPIIDAGIAGEAGPLAPVAGTSVALVVLAHDPDQAPSPLSFAWSATGPAAVAFAPGVGDGHRVVATFAAAGSYLLRVEVTDGDSISTDEAEVVVLQTPSGLAVSPAAATVAHGRVHRFAAVVTDQFDMPLPAASVAWDLTPDSVGAIAANGDYTAPTSGTGTAGVRATVAGLTATASVTIVVPGKVSISRDDAVAAEGTADGARFKVSRSASAATPLPVAVAWSGTATAGSDYGALPETVVIPAGANSVLVHLASLDDDLDEGAETVVGTIVPDGDYTIGKATDSIGILDDERPRIDLTESDASGSENGSDGIAFRLVRYPVNAAVAVPVQVTVGGTAAIGSDVDLATSFTFTGSTSTIAIPVTRIDDAESEGAETIVLGLAPSPAHEVGSASATATLYDDERPLVTLRVDDATAAEPGTDTARLTVTRRPASAAALTVGYSLAGPGADDIAALPGSVILPPDVASAVVTITVVDDVVHEPTQALIVTLAPGPDHDLGAAVGTIAIHDDDPRAPDAIAGTLPGLDYRVYHGTWSQLPDFSVLEPVAEGDVPAVSLAPRLRNDFFAMTFAGYLQVPVAGVYTFATTSDDGSRLWIGETLVVDNDGAHASQERSGTIRLQAGLHRVRIAFFEKQGGEVLSVSWQGPGLAKQTLPAESLFRNAIPVGVADAYEVEADDLLTIVAADGVLANDGDADGHALVAELVGAPEAGTLLLGADGAFTFAAPAEAGPVTFTYRIGDGRSWSAEVEVVIVVQAPPTGTARLDRGGGTAPPAARAPAARVPGAAATGDGAAASGAG